jgi:G:T-mismatch repair DNA endonuclease (very short patch repair protein)
MAVMKILNKRIKYFRKLGYQTLIIWERDLRNLDKLKNRNRLIKKLINFNK